MQSNSSQVVPRVLRPTSSVETRPWAAPAVWLCLLALALPWLGGCGEKEAGSGSVPGDEASIEAALNAYLPLLASAYTTGDTKSLAGHAAPREMASVDKRVADILAMGRVLTPVFKRLTLEDVNIWSHSNAYVTTLEVWDLRTFAAGSEVVLAEELDQSSRVKYQLKREGDTWLVLFRAIQQ